MSSIDIFLNYFSRSSFVTVVVLVWLSIYFLLTFKVLFSRYFYLSSWLSTEKNSLEAMLMGAKNVRDDSILRRCSSVSGSSEKLLNVCKNVAEKNASDDLWLLAIIASTSPFVGLFGTVVSILETFSGLGQSGSASLGVIAPAISEALVATGAGIFVAIPAYSANIFLKRCGYEVIIYVQREIDILLSNVESKKEVAKND
ncbi:MAG: MotA/TolQ/ExbB proton channel family protein [Sulfurospirillaceae bacterium]|nr:MotA/TolQ/ExbB proton channel family protein [Sulfurospirillaceae bacterium]